MTGSWWAAAVEALERPQYGTSMHFPDCLGGGCTGCLPPAVEGEIVDTRPAPFGVIPGTVWDNAVIDGLTGHGDVVWTVDDPDDPWVFAVDGRADGSDRSVVFARVRDGVMRVHVPDVPR